MCVYVYVCSFSSLALIDCFSRQDLNRSTATNDSFSGQRGGAENEGDDDDGDDDGEFESPSATPRRNSWVEIDDDDLPPTDRRPVQSDPMDEETLRRLDAEFGKVMLPMRLVL
jgi:hypothetical protein